MHKRILLLIVIFAAILFATGLFAYPHYENDEGIYMSQAWSVAYQHKLSPYTYWYDHAPLGWIVIAGWLWLTGGISTFGFSVNSGRVLMLLFHLVSTLMVGLIAQRITKRRLPAYIAALIFAASPLVTYYARRVLLDNVMVFFLLLSIFLLVRERRGLASTLLSAFLFACAVLSKETAIIFFPVMLVIAWRNAESRRLLHVGTWAAVVMLVLSLYPVFAIVKGEFVSSADQNKVTFLEALSFQLHRVGGPVWDASSPIRTSLAVWWELDPILVSLWFACLVSLAVMAFRSRRALIAFLLLAFPTAFLFRGSLVIEFYVLVAVPFIAIGFGALIGELLALTRSRALAILVMVLTAAMVLTMAVPLAFSVRHDQNLYFSDQTSVQRQAVFNILDNGTAGQAYLVNAYGITEFLAAHLDPATQPYVEWYVKVETDSAVRERFERYAAGKKLRFVISETADVEPYTKGFDYLAPRWNESIRESTRRKDGWEVATFVEHTPEQMLASTYPSIRSSLDNGRVVVSYDPNATLASAQSLMMLVATEAHDQGTFDRVWAATRRLEYPDGALDWRQPAARFEDPNALSTDPAAEIRAARALLSAYEQWGSPRYLTDAHEVLDGIWKNDVVYAGDGLPYLKAANYAADNYSITTHPWAFDPQAFTLIERYDKAHPWRTLAYTSWKVLDGCTFSLGAGGLPPDVCSVDNRSGTVSALGIDRSEDLWYGFQASRGLQTVASAAVHDDPNALSYIDAIPSLEQDWAARGFIASRYTHTGIPLTHDESVVYYDPALSAFSTSDPYKALEVYGKKIVPQYYPGDPMRGQPSYWEDSSNAITQLWTWLAVRDYADSVTDR